MDEQPTISAILKRAGGANAIEAASEGSITAEAVYKWSKIGIPDRHWQIIISLTGVTTDELWRANAVARAGNGQAGREEVATS